MKKYQKVGVLRETKNPPDKRVALAPEQVLQFKNRFPHLEIVVQPSDLRAYADDEYRKLGITMQEDLSDCDVLLGIKEVSIDKLIPGKTYLFFSHTTKKQSHNRGLLQRVLQDKIRLIDYELLTNSHNVRLVAFGRWAGIVGAYNGLLAYGQRTGAFDMKRAYICNDMDEFYDELMKIKLPPLRILITGGGRVAHGAMETLEPLNIRKISPQKFLTQTFNYPVYTQLDPWHYTKRKKNETWDWEHYFVHPYEYETAFVPYTKVTDMFLACHYWDRRAPKFFAKEDMLASDFSMKVIADISCDLDGPIPATLRTSNIEAPFYGFDPKTGGETDAFNEKGVTVMAVDNLPGEAPRSSSIDFGKDLIDKVLPSLFEDDIEQIIERAAITNSAGTLNPHFSYLQDFVDSKE